MTQTAPEAPPPTGRPRGLLRASLVAAAVALAEPSPAQPVAPALAPAVVLAVGGERLCAQVRLPGGDFQVTCRLAGSTSADGDTLDAPHTWRTPELVSLTTFDASYVGRAWHPVQVAAVGLTRDGAIVAARRGARETERFLAAPVGAPSRLVAVHLVSIPPPPRFCGTGAEFDARLLWLAHTERGEVLSAEHVSPDHDATPPRWTTRFEAVSSYAFGRGRGCVVLARREVRCGRLDDDAPWGAGLRAAQWPRVPWLELGDIVEVKSAGPPGAEVVCTRSRSGDLRCTRDGRALALAAPRPATSLALGDDDLCARDGAGAWWCAAGPAEAASALRRSLAVTLRPAGDGLVGASDVHFAGPTGCARFERGDLRCWGRHARGGWVTHRARAVAIAGVEGATELAVTPWLRCARGADAVRCWGAHALRRGDRVDMTAVPRPVVALVGAVSLGRQGDELCAATERGVLCWGGGGETFPSTSWSPRGASDDPILTVLMAGPQPCVRRRSRALWCRSPGSQQPRREGTRCVEPAVGDVWCYDRALLTPRLDATPLAERGRCVLAEGGRVQCGAATVEGVSDAQAVDGIAEAGCALRQDGRVLCWGSNHDASLTAAEADRAPSLVPFNP